MWKEMGRQHCGKAWAAGSCARTVDPCEPSRRVMSHLSIPSFAWAPRGTSCTQSDGECYHSTNPRAEEGKKAPLVCSCSWLGVRALLQRERGGGGSSDQQKERFTGKQQKGMWPKPCRRLAVHELGTCRRAGKGQGGL